MASFRAVDERAKIIRVLWRLFGRGEKLAGQAWPEPDAEGPNEILLVDGLGSQSTTRVSPPFTPWVNAFAAVLGGLDSTASLRGLSYSAPGRHYGPVHTLISPETRAPALLRPYVPRSIDGSRHFVGFSLGAIVVVFGLPPALDGRAIADDSRLVAVLVQPAFQLTEEYMQALEELAAHRQDIPAPFADLLHDDGTLPERARRHIATLVEKGVPVFIAIWPQDRFVRYSEALMSGLRSVGATVLPLEVASGGDLHSEFQDHAAARDAFGEAEATMCGMV